MMSAIEVISLSDESDTETNFIEIRDETNKLISNDGPKITKKLADIECPICFDQITNATATSCGHIFCLECLQQSISSSTARGQTRKRGVGLCPLCRKQVQFKDSLVLRMKVNKKVVPPSQPPSQTSIQPSIQTTVQQQSVQVTPPPIQPTYSET